MSEKIIPGIELRGMYDEDQVVWLQEQIELLKKQVRELEAENKRIIDAIIKYGIEHSYKCLKKHDFSLKCDCGYEELMKIIQGESHE